MCLYHHLLDHLLIIGHVSDSQYFIINSIFLQKGAYCCKSLPVFLIFFFVSAISWVRD